MSIAYNIFLLMWVTKGFAEYRNTVPDLTPPNPYVEICFKGTEVHVDIHEASESTRKGLCNPGDSGFIIERFKRAKQPWVLALQSCLEFGMRFPDPFEWQLACDHSEKWRIKGMTDSWEWGLSEAIPMIFFEERVISSGVFGNAGCYSGSWHAVGYIKGFQNSHTFRCAR